MAIDQKIFAYNTGSPISGTTQVGDIAVSDANIQYSDGYGGVQWWGGPDETIGYVITHTDPSGSHNGASGGVAYLGFWRSVGLTNSDFLTLCNSIPPRIGYPPFTNTLDASTWLYDNGYWTSFIPPTPTPTPTSTITPTITPTNTPTNTQTSSVTPTQTPTTTPTNTTTNTQTPTPSITATQTPTLTVTPSVSPTTTTTPTPTRTSSTPTPTPTPTLTPSLTPYQTLAGSLLFNGSNQLLGISPGVTFGAGAFTFEGWFNASNLTNKGILGGTGSNDGAMQLYFGSSTSITSDKNGGFGAFTYTMASTISLNQWHYLIYNRNVGGITAVYIDGVRCIATSTDNLNYTGPTNRIGQNYAGYFPGYWTNMRMTIGTAVYNSNLTTQSTPRDPLTSLVDTKYLMLGASVTTDSSGTQTVTNTNGVTQTSNKPFTPPANPPF